MKIALVTLGTRGDVQPYIAVAHALMARGHEVKLAVTDEHAPLLRAYGVAHHSMRGNFREMLSTDLGRAWLTSADSPSQYARCLNELFLPIQRTHCEDADAAVEGADAVAFYGMAVGALHAAQRRKLPAVALSPWPAVPTAEIPPLAAPWLGWTPGFVQRYASDLLVRSLFSGLNQPHLDYRASVGLPPYRSRDPMHFILESGVPCVHLYSETILARPTDWDPRHSVAGFAFAPAGGYAPPRALSDFLSSGPPPVYMGFGSMTGFDPGQLAELAARAARLAGVRAVVASGWAGLAPPPTSEIYVVDEVPHDWLFPQVSAVVHHGGVGTFAEGLRAGKPTVIAAFFGDQPFWGQLNEKLGTGPRALRRRDVNAESLANAIRRAVEDPWHRARAREVGAGLRAEDGAAKAAQTIERHFTARA